jgi:hypothetical protein
MNELRISCSIEIGVMFDGAVVVSDIVGDTLYRPRRGASSMPRGVEDRSDLRRLR